MSSVVSRVEVIEFAYQLAARPGKTFHRWAVRIRTDDGIEGSYVPVWSAPPSALLQVRTLADHLVGHSVGERELLWDHANRTQAKVDRVGAGAIDIALWDALGKALGAPIVDLLGRFRSRLPVYASTNGGSATPGDELGSPESYADFARQCRDRHVPAYKIHGPAGGGLKDEIAVIKAVAQAVGGDMDIMTDPGKRLPTLAQALRLGRVCDEIGAYWWEDPMRDNSPFAHRILREKVRTPLLMTEMVRGLDARAAMALEGGTDFLRADPELDMGITGVMKTAHFAEAIGLDVEVHAAGPAQRHCMAAIRNTNYYELGLLHPTQGNPLLPPVYGPGYDETLDAVGEDGCVAVPDGPGLGVEYDWERILGSATGTHVSAGGG